MVKLLPARLCDILTILGSFFFSITDPTLDFSLMSSYTTFRSSLLFTSSSRSLLVVSTELTWFSPSRSILSPVRLLSIFLLDCFFSRFRNFCFWVNIISIISLFWTSSSKKCVYLASWSTSLRWSPKFYFVLYILP